MTYRFLHISITPINTPLNRAAIEARLNDLGRDWLCYNTLSFVLWTNKSTVTVAEMIEGHLQPEDQFLVFNFATNELPTGRLPSWIWDWINRPRNQWTGDILTSALPAPAATNQFDPNLWLMPPGDKS